MPCEQWDETFCTCQQNNTNRGYHAGDCDYCNYIDNLQLAEANAEFSACSPEPSEFGNSAELRFYAVHCPEFLPYLR